MSKIEKCQIKKKALDLKSNMIKMHIFLFSLFFILVAIVFISKSFANIVPVKSVEIFSDKLDYNKNDAGAWKIIKSAEFIDDGVVDITVDVDTVMRTKDKSMDVLVVLNSSSNINEKKLDVVKESLSNLVTKLLENDKNKVGLIVFNDNSKIESEFTNSKVDLINIINNISFMNNRSSYYKALVSVDEVLKEYVWSADRECKVLFLTSSYPNEDLPNEGVQYKYLKSEYPFILLNSIQYEMGNTLLDLMKKISDDQFIADSKTLNEVLMKATFTPMNYEKFSVSEYIDTDYFSVKKEDISVNKGQVDLDSKNQIINWVISDFSSGSQARMKLKAKLKNYIVGNDRFYKISEKALINSNLDGFEENVESTLTPVVSNSYKVVYDGNAPSDCTVVGVPDTKQVSVLENVEISSTIPVCSGYLFKGWDITNKEITKLNDSKFVMPEDNVIIRAKWGKLRIKKSTDGTVSEGTSLYNQVEEDSGVRAKWAKEYTGDRSTFKGNRKIYYYHSANAKNNNVIFGNYCWKIIRTTDTGGVKILYNGVPSADGKCDNTKEASLLTSKQMGTSSANVLFNPGYDSLGYVGYMYNVLYPRLEKYSNDLKTTFKYGNSFTYENGIYTLTGVSSIPLPSGYKSLSTKHYSCLNDTGECEKLIYIYYYGSGWISYVELTGGKSIDDALGEMLYNDDVNKKDSTVKKAVDYWYKNNMTGYTKYLEDTVWCNDRSMGNKETNGWNPNGGDIGSHVYFKSEYNKTDLTCKNKNDRFTVSSANGNGALTYPVGLIDATETNISYITTYQGSPNNNGKDYWGLSPYNHNNTMTSMFTVSANYGQVGHETLNEAHGVRPAVSLRPGIEYSAGDGSVNSPYIIITK